MRLVKGLAILVATAGVVAVGMEARARAQHRTWELYAERPDGPFAADQQRTNRGFSVLAGRGAEIGVSIADGAGGVVIEEVQPDSPADKAGLKRSDIIVEFDGEHVRSARQFGRLVQETPAGRTVKATVTRDGQRKDVQLTPTEGRGPMTMFLDGDRLRDWTGDRLDGFRFPNFNFDFDFPGMTSSRQLGVTVDELTHQLADYFGARDGVLVTSVTDGSAAARAGLKAGDVITSINGTRVTSREDLVRGMRDSNEDVSIGIVRDKKESTLKAKIEPARRPARGRPA